MDDLIPQGQPKNLGTTIGLFLGPCGAILLYFTGIPGLSPQAHHLACILVLVIVWWITECIPIPATALIGAALCVVFEIEGAKKVMSGFSDPVIFLFLGSFLLAEGMAKHGLDQRIAYSILSSRLVDGRPRRVLFFLGLVSVAASMWMSNTGTVAMMMPIVMGILRTFSNTTPGVGAPQSSKNIPMKSTFGTGLVLMVAYGASIGGLATPVGTPPNLIGISLIENLIHIKISFLTWMLMGLPITFIMFFVLFGIIFWIYRPQKQRVDNLMDYVRTKKKSLGKLSKGEFYVIICFGLTVTMWLLPGILGLAVDKKLQTAIESKFPEAIAALLGGCALFVLPTNWAKREFTLTWKDATKIDWGTMLLFGAGIALGNLMFQTGLAAALGAGLVSLLGATSLWAITATAIGMGIVISEITSNTASANMVIPVVISFAQAAGVDPLTPALGACIGASFGFMFPVSTPPNAIAFGSGMVSIKQMMKTGIFLDMSGFLTLSLIIEYGADILR